MTFFDIFRQELISKTRTMVAMAGKIKKLPSGMQRLRWVVLLLILVPVLTLIVHEYMTLESDAARLRAVYSRQFDSILSTVNQQLYRHAEAALRKAHSSGARLPDWLTANFVYRPGGDSLAAYAARSARPPAQSAILSNLQKHQGVLRRSLLLQQQGYRRISPVRASAEDSLLLWLWTDESGVQFQGIAVAEQLFIDRIVQPEMQSAGGDDFQISLIAAADSSLAEASPAAWLLPGSAYSIILRDQTISDLARQQFNRSALLVSLITILLLFGGWLIYRSTRAELQLAQMKSDFVSNVSHELKTPLALIRMFAETLELGRVGAKSKQQEYYRIIGQESERLSHLVNNILNFSRIEAGAQSYQLRRCDLNSIVNSLANAYAYHLEQNGFELDVQLAETPLWIDADENAIAEALLNLIDNGMKFSRDDKEIALRTGQADNQVWIEVQDAGIGIAPELLPRIFEKFRRLESRDVQETRGAGLGLSLVQGIMQAHHGEITAQSTPGSGSRFRMVFPIAATHAKEESAERD